MSKISSQPPSRMRSITEGIPPPSRPPPVLSSQLDISYSPESQTLVDIVKNSRDLPRVVKCDASSVRSTRLPFNISQPLLLHSRRSVIKVAARSVVFDKEKGRIKDTGDDILVPEDYPGWFGVLGSPCEIKSDVSIPNYRSVGKVGVANCQQFLVGGTSCINGFTRVAGDQKWMSYIISPGEVLRKVGIYQERIPRKSSLLKKKENKIVVNVYLRCYDTSDREVLLLTSQEGLFYSLKQEGPLSRSPILTMSQILQRYKDKFPLVVKLLYGPVPKINCAFKDTLQLTEAELSHTVIASTVENLRNINLEIPLDNDLRFSPAVHNTALTTSRQYQQALAECEAKAPAYKRNMKVIVGFNNGEDLPPPPLRSDSLSADCVTSASGDKGQTEPMDSVNSDDSPVSVRRVKSFSENSSRRSSRLSIISRVITLNAEEQNIFTSNIPASPETPTSPKGRQLSLKTKKKSIKTSVPGQLALLEEYNQPPEPETIQAVHSQTSISKVGQERREKFLESRLKVHEYESPNPVFISKEDPEDPNVYGQLWSSASMNRASGAGIKIDSKPGKPTDSQPDFDPPPSGLTFNDLTLDHITYDMISPLQFSYTDVVDASRQPPFFISRSSSRASSLSLSSEQSTSEIWDFQRDHVPGQNEQPQYENTIPSSVEISTPTSDLSSQQPYDAANVDTTQYKHVYNDLIEEHRTTAPRSQSLLSCPAPHSVTNNFNGSSNFHESDCVNADYITPTEINYYATPKDLSHPSNPYVEPSDALQETDQVGDGLAFFEFTNEALRSCRDSGVEADDLPESIIEDPYDYPAPSARQSTVVGLDLNVYGAQKPENSIVDALQQRLQERNKKMTTASLLPCDESSPSNAQPLHVNINPPPVPGNHPASRLTPNSAVVNLIHSIHNASPTTPETFTKDVLLEQLKSSGLKPTSEFAFQSLQVADVTMLAQRQEDLDEVLVSLLPTVGTVDLRKISMCIKNLIRKINTK